MQVPSSTSHTTILALLNPIKSAVFRLDYLPHGRGISQSHVKLRGSHFGIADFLKLCDTLPTHLFKVSRGVVRSPA